MTDLEALRAIIDHQLRGLLRLPHFPAKVIVQHGDLTVDVAPDSPYLPGLSGLQLRTFVPGATIKIAPGTRVAVVFEDGDRTRPVAVPVFDQDAGELLELHLGDAGTDIVLAEGTKGVVRVDDVLGNLQFVPGSSGATLTWNGTPVTAGGLNLTAGNGSTKVKAG